MALFDWITARLAVGGAIATEAGVQAVLAAGITAVLNVSDSPDVLLLALAPQLSYLWNGIPDDGQPKPTYWFTNSLDFVLPRLLVPRHKVLCHCSYGINRGPSIVYAVLLALGLSSAQAISMIETARPETRGGIAYRGNADTAVRVLGYV